MSDQPNHICEEKRCTSEETEQYRWPLPGPDEQHAIWLCVEHAIENGFCVWCNHFGAGSEDYDFSGHEGYHRDCWEELEAEAGDDPDDDEMDWFDMYPAAWYDPDSPLSELEPPETPTHRYIGPGSEYEVEDDEG